MNRRFACLFVFAAFCLPRTADAVAPKIDLIYRDRAEFNQHLAHLVETLAEQPKQWKWLKEYLDAFLEGVAAKRPAVISVITDTKTKKVKLQLHVPINDLRAFRNNLVGWGFKTTARKRVRNPRGLIYRVTAGATRRDRGRMFHNTVSNYVHIAETEQELQEIIKAKYDPSKAHAADLKKPGVLIGSLKNTVGDAAAVKTRRDAFESVQKEILAGVKRNDAKGETKEDFELRKLLTEQQLNELGRYFSEAKDVRIAGVFEIARNLGRLDFSLSALENTQLGEAIALWGKKPSYFAEVERPADASFLFRLNHPLDSVRKKQGKEITALLRTRFAALIAASPKIKDGEKEKARTAVNSLLDGIDRGLEKGIADAFMNMTPNKGRKELDLVGGMRADAQFGKDLLAATGVLAELAEGVKLTRDVAKEGDVSIHKVDIPAKDDLSLQIRDLVGDELYLGIGPEAIYLGGGPNGMNKLRAAIKAASHDAKGDKDEVIYMKVQPLPFVDSRTRLNLKTGDPELRKVAKMSFKENDAVVLTLRKTKDGVAGNLELQKGMLTFIGHVLARFSEKNLKP